MRRWIQGAFVILAVCAIFLLPRPCEAAMSNSIGAGSKAVSLGGAFTAIADDFTASFYNPAGLANIKHRELVSGWMYGGYAINSGSNRNIDQIQGAILGNVFPFEVLGMKWSFGLYNFWPKSGAQIFRIQTDEFNVNGPCAQLVSGPSVCGLVPRRRPTSVIFGNDQRHLDFVTGLGLRVNDYLSVGLGFRALADIKGTSDVSFINSPKGKGVLEAQPPGAGAFSGVINARPRLRPIVGVLIDTQKGFRIGGAYRWENKLPFRLRLNTITTLPAGSGDLTVTIPVTGVLESVSFYQPAEASLGFSWDMSDKVSISVEGTWQRWSKRPTSELRGNFASVPSLTVPPGQGVSGPGSIDFVPPLDPQFKDIFIPRIGLTYQIKRVWRLRLGYAYMPSPVDDPRGGFATDIRDAAGNVIARVSDEQNYADSNKQVFTIGMGIEQDDPFEWFELPTTIDVHYGIVKFSDRKFETLDAASNPFGNFTNTGTVWFFGLTNTARF